jgi:Xaa-Pro aminopeptidase
LHYRKNARRMEAGDLLLIDAGAEMDYYACDVTRTFPVSGRFTEPQRAIYELVLEAQLAAIAAVKPGATVDGVHAVTVRTITEGLVRLGLLEGAVDERIEKNDYKAFYMHRTSHWLGMDVHDVGAYYVGGESRVLTPGMVLTIEPGLYISTRATTVAEMWRGIGVRTEDDVLVTADGHEVLTASIPKTVADLEAGL